MDKWFCALPTHSCCPAIFAGAADAFTLPCATQAHFTVNHYSFCVFRFRPFHSFIMLAVSALSTFFAVVFRANLAMLVLSAHFHISINWCFTLFVCVGFERTVQWQRNKGRDFFLFSIRILFPFCLDERTIYSHFFVIETTEFRLLFVYLVNNNSDRMALSVVPSIFSSSRFLSSIETHFSRFPRNDFFVRATLFVRWMHRMWRNEFVILMNDSDRLVKLTMRRRTLDALENCRLIVEIQRNAKYTHAPKKSFTARHQKSVFP